MDTRQMERICSTRMEPLAPLGTRWIHESIREFWSDSVMNPCQQYHLDPEGRHRCAVCYKVYKRTQDPKSHKTKSDHYNSKINNTTNIAVVDATLEKKKGRTSLTAKSEVGNERSDERVAHQVRRLRV